MGMFKDDAGKTEKPTAGRLNEASNKGNVPLSKEFTMAATLLIAVFVMMGIGELADDACSSELMRTRARRQPRRTTTSIGASVDPTRR